MAKDDYLVVFTGKLVKGVAAADALEGVARLFKTDAQKVRKVFKGPGAAVVKNLDRERAEKYVESLRKAGVVCAAMSEEEYKYKTAAHSSAKPEKPQQDNLPLSGSVTEAPTQDEAPAAPAAAEGPRVVDIKLGGTQVSYSPLTATSLAASPGGIDLLQRDTGPLLFEDILMLAAFKSLGWSEEKFNLVIFTTRGKRPYIIEADKIFYAEFPEVSGFDVAASLRSFIKMVFSKQPGLVLDSRTKGFAFDGADPMILDKEPLVLTTALARGLSQSSGSYSKAAEQKAAAASPPRHVEQPESLKAHAAQMRRSTESSIAAIGSWANRRCIISGVMLALGFAMPLIKHSLLYKENVVLMPWHIMGLGLDTKQMAASATVSQAGMKLPWTLIPLVLAIAAFAMAKMKPGARYASMLIAGAAALFILSAPMHQQHEILGVLFLPQNFAGGVMFFLFIFAAAMIVTSARVLELMPDSRAMRMAAGASGMFMLLGLLVAVMALAGTWLSLPMLVLFALMAAFAWHGITLYRDPDAQVAQRAVFIGWAVAALTPVAGIIAQTRYADPTTISIINSGGGLMNVAISMVKACLIYFGAAYLMASGLTALVKSTLLRRA